MTTSMMKKSHKKCSHPFTCQLCEQLQQAAPLEEALAGEGVQQCGHHHAPRGIVAVQLHCSRDTARTSMQHQVSLKEARAPSHTLRRDSLSCSSRAKSAKTTGDSCQQQQQQHTLCASFRRFTQPDQPLEHSSPDIALIFTPCCRRMAVGSATWGVAKLHMQRVVHAVVHWPPSTYCHPSAARMGDARMHLNSAE